MIDTTITNSATTFTIGCSMAEEVREDPDRQRLLGAGREDRDDDLVERQREREQSAREEGRAHLRERHVTERLPGIRPEVRRCLVQGTGRAPQARYDVVVDDDDAERRMPDDDRRQAERHAERSEDVDDRRLQREARDDPRERDREDHGERDHLAAEER